MPIPSASRISAVIAPAIEQLGYEFVACELVPMGRRMLLRIYIDSKEGVTIRDCEIVSRQTSALLDVEDPIIGKYNLEVSSPGFDRLLVTEEHFKLFIGQLIKVKLRQGRNGRRNYLGSLQAVTDGEITVIVDGETYVLPISEIVKANIVPEN